jgi:hypothetical protein
VKLGVREGASLPGRCSTSVTLGDGSLLRRWEDDLSIAGEVPTGQAVAVETGTLQLGLKERRSTGEPLFATWDSAGPCPRPR